MAKKPAQENGAPKFCFVVSPISSPGSAERKRSNGLFREVIEPVAAEAGYRVERADHDKGPGMVTEGIVNKLIEADLVIADLHGPNPNVMYEVAIRHATGSPIIQMMPEGEALPFDIGGLNTIFYDPDVDGLAKWRADLKAALVSVASGGGGDNPVSRAGVYRALAQRPESDEKTIGMEVLRRLGALETAVLGVAPALIAPDLTFFTSTSHRAVPGTFGHTLEQTANRTKVLGQILSSVLKREPDSESAKLRVDVVGFSDLDVIAADGRRALQLKVRADASDEDNLGAWMREIEIWLRSLEA